MTDSESRLIPPPLTLYVHLPWCVKKCPYCDFNSHALTENLPEGDYIDALLADLEQDLPLVWGRPVHSIFFGGGTPSLFSAKQLDRFLSAVRGLLPLAPNAEITLEANPGTVEHDSFLAYRDAGINRVSLGVQSFDDTALRRIGRIHGAREAEKAAEMIRDAGLDNYNIDLMYGLPGQSIQQAVKDVETALQLSPSHISHYQLTLEPNTAFHANPPTLPGDESCWDMQEASSGLLAGEGFEQYEISAWARKGKPSAHNLNYWRYGDYLGIGAGAHGKITLAADNEIRRTSKQRHPKAYLRAIQTGDWLAESRSISENERCFEFFLNQLRLRGGVHVDDFSSRTGLDWDFARENVAKAEVKGLLKRQANRLVPTGLGWRFINEIQELFLPQES